MPQPCQCYAIGSPSTPRADTTFRCTYASPNPTPHTHLHCIVLPAQRHSRLALVSTRPTPTSSGSDPTGLNPTKPRPHRSTTDSRDHIAELSVQRRPREPPTKTNRIQRRCTLDRTHLHCYKPRDPLEATLVPLICSASLPTQPEDLAIAETRGNRRRRARAAGEIVTGKGWRLLSPPPSLCSLPLAR
jgi:hypothetical protein